MAIDITGINKKRLYEIIEDIRTNFLKVATNDYPLNLIEMCKEDDAVFVEYVPFKTRSLRGMAVVDHTAGGTDIILLNSNRPAIEHNLVCAHELIHLLLHRHLGASSFNCYDTIQSSQNSYIEWQANEGGAELLAPYKDILPIIKDNFPFTNYHQIRSLRNQLAARFNVTTTVIEMRLESLKYEIEQYLSGVDINDLEIISLTKQKERGIRVTSLNDLESQLFYLQYNMVQ